MINIRKATHDDTKALLDLILDLAKYHTPKTDLDQIIDSGFSQLQSPKL